MYRGDQRHEAQPYKFLEGLVITKRPRLLTLGHAAAFRVLWASNGADATVRNEASITPPKGGGGSKKTSFYIGGVLNPPL